MVGQLVVTRRSAGSATSGQGGEGRGEGPPGPRAGRLRRHLHDRPVVPALVPAGRALGRLGRQERPRRGPRPPGPASRDRQPPRPPPEVDPRGLLVHHDDPLDVPLGEHVVVEVVPRDLRPIRPTQHARAGLVVEERPRREDEQEQQRRPRQLLLHLLVLLLLPAALLVVLPLLLALLLVVAVRRAAVAAARVGRLGLGLVRGLAFVVLVVVLAAVTAVPRPLVAGYEVLEPLGYPREEPGVEAGQAEVERRGVLLDQGRGRQARAAEVALPAPAVRVVALV